MEKSRPVAELVKKLAIKYNATPSQVALNWLIHFSGDTVVAIPGATKATHAAENTGAMKFSMTSEDMHQLDTISKLYT
jgi:aryl-alcohol dehydrogenase-like predicted oxidoreductase